MGYGLWADIIVAFHAVYVSFVVLGQVAVLVGAALKWGWVRNRWFRVAHLVAILFVVLETIIGMACPLTVWEDQLRRQSGQTVEEGSFMGRWMHALIFYDFRPWVFTATYLGFALLVVATLFLVPPRWRRDPR